MGHAFFVYTRLLGSQDLAMNFTAAHGPNENQDLRPDQDCLPECLLWFAPH